MKRYKKRYLVKKPTQIFKYWSGKPELKQNFYTLASTAVPNTGYLFHLTGITPGTGSTQRIGNKCQLKLMTIKGQVGVAGNQGGAFSTWSEYWDTVTLFVLRIRGIPVAQTASQFITSYLTPGGNANFASAILGKSKIVKRKSFNLKYGGSFIDATTTGSGSGVRVPEMKNFVINIRPKGLKGVIEWDGTGADDLKNNGYFLLAVSDSSAIPHPTLELSVTNYYTDI